MWRWCLHGPGDGALRLQGGVFSPLPLDREAVAEEEEEAAAVASGC
jgi:hypothetical protein